MSTAAPAEAERDRGVDQRGPAVTPALSLSVLEVGRVALTQQRRTTLVLGFRLRLRLHQRSRLERDPGDVAAADAHVVELALGIALELGADALVGRPTASQKCNSFQKLHHLFHSFGSLLALTPRTA